MNWPDSTGYPRTGPWTFALIGDRWYAVGRDGEVMDDKPIELAQARGTRECAHCGSQASGYCRSCRRAVCFQGDCFPAHYADHVEWRERRVGWTKVGED